MITTRRFFLAGASMFAAPAIVHASSLMPISTIRVPLWLRDPLNCGATPLTMTTRIRADGTSNQDIQLKFDDGQTVSFIEKRPGVWLRGELDSRSHMGRDGIVEAASGNDGVVWLRPKGGEWVKTPTINSKPGRMIMPESAWTRRSHNITA